MSRLSILAFLFVSFYAFGFSSHVHAQNSFRGMTAGTDKPQDFVDLRALGANLVSFQIIWTTEADTADEVAYNAFLDGRLVALDQVLATCQQIGLKVLIVLHTPPGGFDDRTPGKARHSVFAKKWAQDALITTWQKIATRYAGNTAVYGYDLLNEPAERNVASGLLTWNELAPKLVQTIRAIDTTTKIVVEPTFGNQALLSKLTPISDSNIAYSIHTYFPPDFRRQGLDGRKINVYYPKKKFNKAALKKSVKKAFKFMKKHKVKLLVGEVSALRWAPKGSAFRYLRDYINIFEKYKWDWTVHAWREADVWSIEHTSDPKNPNKSPVLTDRAKLLMKYWAKNK